MVLERSERISNIVELRDDDIRASRECGLRPWDVKDGEWDAVRRMAMAK